MSQIRHIEIHVEGKSDEIIIRRLAGKIFTGHNHLTWAVKAYDGWPAMQSILPARLKVAISRSNVFTIILIDQDSADCRERKKKFTQLIPPQLLPRCKVRIACREIENWMLGDLDAVEKADPSSKAIRLKGQAGFRLSSEIENQQGWESLGRISKFRTKSAAAIAIAPHLSVEQGVNKAASFQAFVSVLRAISKGYGRA